MKKLALILAIIGALNWGGIGVLGTDLLGSLFGGTYSMISRIVYALVGVAGLYLIPTIMSDDRYK